MQLVHDCLHAIHAEHHDYEPADLWPSVPDMVACALLIVNSSVISKDSLAGSWLRLRLSALRCLLADHTACMLVRSHTQLSSGETYRPVA